MMREERLTDYRSILPGELTLGDIERARRLLENTSRADLNQWTNDRLRVYNTYSGQRFRMLEDHPVDNNEEKVVFVSTEFGTNALARAVIKARIIRDTVDPTATLILQPNSVVSESNMNFSRSERKKLYEGNLQPTTDRIKNVMDGIRNPLNVTMFGASQGAMVALDYAANKDTSSVAVAIVEIPNIVERNSEELMFDFMNSGRDLSQVVKANFMNHESELAVLFESDAVSKLSLARFAFKSLCLDNFAMIGAMRHAAPNSNGGRAVVIDNIDSVLRKGGSVVNAWGDQDDVSPDWLNRYISSIPIFKNNSRYTSRKLVGASHAISDFYALDGALARLANNNKSAR
jgi:pimeloyl-ACP methyl ester carboxylesterase